MGSILHEGPQISCRNFSDGLTVCLVGHFCKVIMIINFTLMGCEQYCDTASVSRHLAESVDAHALLASVMAMTLPDSFNSKQRDLYSRSCIL